jgi:23S rRNA pseudouridine2605 synthase
VASRRSGRPAGHVSLDRALSKLGVTSRAAARTWILEGRVRVNGRVVREPSHPVSPERTPILVDGTPARRAAWRTIVLNKERGTVTTRRDPEGRRTVFDGLGNAGRSLVAVGRLDRATTGLLILTTDTQLAARLSDPASGIVRRYAVTVRGLLTDASAERMLSGIDDLRAHSIDIRKRSTRESHLIVELTEGRNREIRRLCEGCGHQVTALKRIAFGGLELGRLEPGRWRDLSRAEVSAAFGIGAADGRR